MTAASGELVDATDSPSAVLDLLRDEQKKASDAMADHLHGIMAHLQQVEHAVRDEDAAPQDIDRTALFSCARSIDPDLQFWYETRTSCR